MVRPTVSKIDAIEKQLAAAIYLLLRDFPPVAIHTLIGAARGLLYGLHKNSENRLLKTWDQRIIDRIVPGNEKEWRKYQNKVANFLKHADRDATELLTGVDIEGLNEIELTLCVTAFWYVKQPLPQRLMVGLLYCNARNRGWLDLRQMILEAGMPVTNFDEFEAMSDGERKRTSLDAFEILIQRGIE